MLIKSQIDELEKFKQKLKEIMQPIKFLGIEQEIEQNIVYLEEKMNQG